LAGHLKRLGVKQALATFARRGLAPIVVVGLAMASPYFRRNWPNAVCGGGQLAIGAASAGIGNA